MSEFAASASPSSFQPDAVLARAAQGGEKAAFVEIVARHQALVYGVALGVLGDFAASEDAAQEAFIAAWRKIHELREPEKLRAWLVQIARNVALGQLRRKRGMDPLGEAAGDYVDENQALPDQLTVSREEAALVRAALQELPEKFRLPLVLFYGENQSTKEVAEALELSEDAVRQRLARGRDLLRGRFSGLIETALRLTRPGALFTMTIAAAIGALTAPAVMAGGAFAAVAASSALAATSASASASVSAGAAASTTPVAVTAMTTSKLSLTAAALVAAACLPLGYTIHAGMGSSLTDGSGPAGEEPDKTAPLSAKPDFGGSGLFAEWVRLHEEHGHDASAMPALFKAISSMGDTFRRRAFRAALVAEWGQVDPAGGMDFFLGETGNREAARQLFLEWLARDPQAAMAKLSGMGAAGDKLAGEAAILTAIARHAPEHVASIASRLPEITNHWSHPVADAFAILVGRDLESARAAAEILPGPRRNEALTGVAREWAKRDFDRAAQWVKTLPDDVDRDCILRGALTGLAGTDPTAALAKVDLVPPGGRAGYFADTTAARLLKEAGARDFDGTTAWLRDHPGKISGEDMTGLAAVVTDKLNADPEAFLNQQLAKGTLGLLGPALGSALMNDSKSQLAKVCQWLKDRPEDDSTRDLRLVVMTAASWQNPDLALAVAAQLPANPEGEQQMANFARNLVSNHGPQTGRFEEMYSQTTGRMRKELLAAAFQYLNPEMAGDPVLWTARLEELPAEARAGAAAQLAGAWAANHPAEAAAWATHLPDVTSRADAVQNVARVWMQSDSLAASEWIAQLPAGRERDAGAGVLVHEIAEAAPDEAWQWAVSISEASLRMRSAGQVLAPLAKHHPAEALRWIDQSGLPDQEKLTLRIQVNAGSAPSQIP